MTTSKHGLALLEEDVFEGHMAVRVVVHGETLMMSDQEFRDLMRCAADLFPSMLPVREPARVTFSAPAPIVPRLPRKECCGLELGEKCECTQVRMCQQCGFRKATVFDIDGQWCDDECQRNDRVSEMRGWAR